MPKQTRDVITLAIDVGGTGVKAILLDSKGKPISEGEREDTPQPATPEAILRIVNRFAAKLTGFDRVSVGFPGVVKGGATLTAHNLHPKWIGFDLEKVLSPLLEEAGASC